jgi:hypothetical protein
LLVFREEGDRSGGGGDGLGGLDAGDEFVALAGEGAGHGILGNAHGLEIFLQKDFAGSDGSFHGYNAWRYGRRSMVIHDGDLGGSGIRPTENDPPLVVDADGMEPKEGRNVSAHADGVPIASQFGKFIVISSSRRTRFAAP